MTTGHSQGSPREPLTVEASLWLQADAGWPGGVKQGEGFWRLLADYAKPPLALAFGK